MNEQVVLEVDPRSVLSAIKQANTAMEGWEKNTVGAGDKMQKSLERMAEMLLKVNDKSRNSMERLTQSIEKQSAAYGNTGVEKLIAERDRLIKKLGDEQGMVDRVTASYAKMIAAEGKSGGGGIQGMVSGAQNFASSPMDAIKGMLSSAGPEGMAIAGIATALTAVAAAGFSATSSLADYGVQVRDVEIRTGLAAKEVGQFSFAAKAVGQDISVFERSMRGLTEAVTDTTDAGDKAREALKKLGVAPRDAEGQIRPTADLLLDLSKGLNQIPDAIERNKVGMDIFKRAWLEMAPAMLDLSTNLERAKALGLGPSESDIQRFVKYKEELTEADALWSKVGRKLKEGIAGTIWIDLKGAGAKFALALMGQTDSNETANTARMSGFGGGLNSAQQGDWQRNPYARQYGVMPGGENYLDIAAINAARNAKASSPGALEASAVGDMASAKGLTSYIKNNGGLEGAQEQLSRLKKTYDEARNSAEQLASSGSLHRDVAQHAKEEVDKARVAYEKQNDLVKQLSKAESQRIAQLEKINDLIAKGESFYIVGSGRNQTLVTSQDMSNRMPRHTPTLFGGNGMSPQQREAYAGYQVSVGNSLNDPNYKEGFQVVGQNEGKPEAVFVSPQASRTFKPGEESKPVLDARQKGIEDRDKQKEQIRLSNIQAESNATVRLLELRSGPNGELATARMVASIRQDTLSKEFAITGDLVKLRTGERQNELDFQVKVAEIEKKQSDQIHQSAESLAHTLLTKPGDFGKQLGGTVRDAALKPLESAMADMVTGVLKPIIFGSDGQGGISGFMKEALGGGKQDPMKISTDLNSQATERNTAAIKYLSYALGAGGNGGNASFGSGGGISYGPMGSDGGFAMPIGGDGAANIAGIPSFNGSPVFGGSGGGGLGGMLKGGGGTGGMLANLGKSWGSLKSSIGLGNVHTDSWGGKWATVGNDSVSLDSLGGYTKAIGSSPAAGMAGSMLAMNGLMGAHAGTWGGALEGAAGGALIGNQIGGPFGAAVGASLGFEIGAFEKLFGVESPTNEAKRLVKQTYGLSIDTNMAKQIVSLAQQKYSGHVSIAVRDPDIRKMLELYAAGTGKAFPMSAATPHAGSLVEQGGKLYQQATSQYGNLYSFQSSLPVAGGFSTGQYPSPTSLVLDGPATTALLSGQIANTVNPGYVQSQYSNAMASSDGRLSNSAMMQQPGLITF
jgi:hypothetical protein